MGINKYQIGHDENYSVAEDIATYYGSNPYDKNILKMAKRIKTYIQEVLGFNGISINKIPGAILSELPKALNLTVTEFTPMLGVSKSKYYRVIEENSLSNDVIDKLSSVLKLYESGVNSFEGDAEDFNSWLHNKNPNLGQIEPYKLMATETGRSAVMDAINRIEYNVYG